MKRLFMFHAPTPAQRGLAFKAGLEVVVVPGGQPISPFEALKAFGARTSWQGCRDSVDVGGFLVADVIATGVLGYTVATFLPSGEALSLIQVFPSDDRVGWEEKLIDLYND